MKYILITPIRKVGNVGDIREFSDSEAKIFLQAGVIKTIDNDQPVIETIETAQEVVEQAKEDNKIFAPFASKERKQAEEKKRGRPAKKG